MNAATHVLLLTGYATTVATCAPRLLSWSNLPRRSPALALALWHMSIGSAGFAIGLAALKLVSAARYLPIGRDEPHDHGNSPTETLVGVLIGLLILAFASTRLVLAARRLTRARRSTRERHLELLSVLGRHDPDLDATVVPSVTAAAYCVAGTRQVVITDRAVRLLEPRQISAVLAHERAHLAGRHHLIVGWAGLLVAAFPGIAVLQRLREATSHLVELLADDTARRLVDGSSLATAIVVLGRDTPNGSLAATGGQTLDRVERLLDPPPERWSPAVAAVSALPPFLVGTPLLLATLPTNAFF
ncbi:M56 family metallopeptidase [Kribbella sancticallisti]|uniref:M56 family metallopeptidase n=1 Tax=Kribbella sancticallisti TaxID=460087 RepID=A0ABN2DM63_9ACTN